MTKLHVLFSFKLFIQRCKFEFSSLEVHLQLFDLVHLLSEHQSLVVLILDLRLDQVINELKFFYSLLALIHMLSFMETSLGVHWNRFELQSFHVWYDPVHLAPKHE